KGLSAGRHEYQRDVRERGARGGSADPRPDRRDSTGRRAVSLLCGRGARPCGSPPPPGPAASPPKATPPPPPPPPGPPPGGAPAPAPVPPGAGDRLRHTVHGLEPYVPPSPPAAPGGSLP